MLVLTATAVRDVLNGAEVDVLDSVRSAYIQHTLGMTALPHSVFLRFPGRERDRIIALPAYLGGDHEIAGIKWIASFPDNIRHGQERASASILLNCMRTGRPTALLEGSVISARRTAASAALAASVLAAESDLASVTMIGCGVINFEVLRFLKIVHPDLATAILFDQHPERAHAFAARVGGELPALTATVAENLPTALAASTLVSIATTAAKPYLDTALLRPATLVLHISLRDILPGGIRSATNVVDDADHVCRAATSLELAEQRSGNRSFITTSIGDILYTGRTGIRSVDRATIFSPFGLGILDLAVAEMVRQRAEAAGSGIRIDDFLPVAAGTRYP